MRWSRYIGRKAARSLLHSPRTALALHRPLNTQIIINWWQLGVPENRAVEVFARLRNEWFASWSRYSVSAVDGSLKKRNSVPTYAYVFEAPNRHVHVHWMLHLEPGNKPEFIKKLRRWLMRALGLSELPSWAVWVQPIYNAEGLKKYLAKGARPDYAEYCKIDPEECGEIFGLRCGTSRNIGPKEYVPRYHEYKRRNSRRYKTLARAA